MPQAGVKILPLKCTGSFSSPTGIALDSSGNLIVADAGNGRICKIAPNGTVTTLAGGKMGFQDGKGRTAQFFNVLDVAVNAAGTIIVLDGNRLRKLAPDGTVTTLTGMPGVGVQRSTVFNMPLAIAVNAEGTVFVADAGSSSIRAVSPNGAVSTVASNVGLPTGIAVDALGNVVVVDHAGGAVHCLRRILETDCKTLTYTDTVTVRFAENGQRLFVSGMTLMADGTIIALDHGGEIIRAIHADGATTTLAYSAKRSAVATTSKSKGRARYAVPETAFFSASDIVVGANGTMFFTDPRTSCIRRLLPSVSPFAQKRW
jgi:DNA-binding beta-propeller fold protein YncE